MNATALKRLTFWEAMCFWFSTQNQQFKLLHPTSDLEQPLPKPIIPYAGPVSNSNIGCVNAFSAVVSLKV